jgi:hypothetical protein
MVIKDVSVVCPKAQGGWIDEVAAITRRLVQLIPPAPLCRVWGKVVVRERQGIRRRHHECWSQLNDVTTQTA